jgi:hypothetical protein
MRRIFSLCVIVVLITASQVYGEYFFRYVDENGVVSYTDDLSKVPKKQRDDVKSFASVQQGINKNPDFEKQASTDEGLYRNLDDSGTDENKGYDEFRLIKESLEQDFELLNKEREDLAMERKQLNNEAAVRAFNQKASALNERIKAYELKKQAYMQKFTNDVQKNTQ